MRNAEVAEAAFRCALAIEGAKSLVLIQDEVRSYGIHFGYDRFVLFSASTARDELVERVYWVEGDWFSNGGAIDAETYIRHCPVMRHILETSESFFWTKTIGTEGGRYRVVRAPVGLGVHGLQVPVYGLSGLEGAMSVGGERINASAQVRMAFRLIAHAAFMTARKLLESPAEDSIGGLSEREREVLAWTAAGRRQIEIAATLGLSERTIENHLRRIRKRLGVVTTAQAIRRGEIVS
ncbi:LuxR family transcriptional regulator [Lampropedia puyangensis]|uniref:LuxR family transcriptional regulator n=1 Tax=Lampropedia puyangensis TaxID=1330072 RepID=A0A4S8EMD7_9BURK|nr:PA1136 family autoinducer-binding transcriptional regulator [Lampropedia puyangensis]THT95899.1 LuxR family transcriptional regulator [Lampropedia puyangensis]